MYGARGGNGGRNKHLAQEQLTLRPQAQAYTIQVPTVECTRATTKIHLWSAVKSLPYPAGPLCHHPRAWHKLESPLPVSARLFPAYQAAQPPGICRQHKVLTSLLAEVKTSSQQIIFFYVPYYFKSAALFPFGGAPTAQSVYLGGVFLWVYLMVFVDSFESSVGIGFFLVTFKYNMEFVCQLLEGTGFKMMV